MACKKDVLSRLADGKSPKQIAEELGCATGYIRAVRAREFGNGRATSKAYRTRNREAYLAYGKSYYARNREARMARTARAAKLKSPFSATERARKRF